MSQLDKIFELIDNNRISEALEEIEKLNIQSLEIKKLKNEYLAQASFNTRLKDELKVLSNPISHSEIEDIDWEFVYESILEGRAVLFIGNRFALNEQGEPIQEAFFKDYYQKNRDKVHSYLNNEGLLLFQSNSNDIKLRNDIKKFYKQDFEPALMQKIATIPFHVIISAMPDTTLKRVFEAEYPNQYQYSFFNDRNTPVLESAPSMEYPYLYQIFGTIENDDSLILSYQDLFKYLRKGWIADKPSLPKQLKIQISHDHEQKIQHIFFLGFDFDKWYFQLLLNLLDLDKLNIEKYASIPEAQGEIKILCNQHFNIGFINKNIETFINHLYELFNVKNQLRKKVKTTLKPTEAKKQEIVDLIDNGSIADAFDELDKYKIQNPNLGRLKNEFISGKSDAEFYDRLKTFVKNL
jgi:hypothetical protein